jgi:hypothetical protein
VPESGRWGGDIDIVNQMSMFLFEATRAIRNQKLYFQRGAATHAATSSPKILSISLAGIIAAPNPVIDLILPFLT